MMPTHGSRKISGAKKFSFFHQLSPHTLIYHYELHQSTPYYTICGLSVSSCADETQTLDEERSSGRVFFFSNVRHSQLFDAKW